MLLEKQKKQTYFSVGAYTPEEAGRVLTHAVEKRIPVQTYGGPLKEFKLPDGASKITVGDKMIAVVLMTTDLTKVQHFWDGFEFPQKGSQSTTA